MHDGTYDGNIKILLALAFLLGVVVTGLAMGLAGQGSGTAALAAGAGAGLFGLGLGIGGLYVGLTAARRRAEERPVPRHPQVPPPAIGESLPTVTDYYRNAPDGEPLRRATDPSRRLPDPHWLREFEAGEDDPDRPADA